MALGKRRLVAGLIAILLGTASPARAVFLFSTDVRNTTAPTGSLVDSGWQFQGTWGNFLGTPIGPHHFITAAHISVQPGNFVLNGQPFTSVQSSFDPDGSDLQIVQVQETFGSFAPLFTTGDEVGRDLVVFGRGTPRGDPVTLPQDGGVLKGWRWGETDGVQSWGENRVSRVDGPPARPDDFISFAFDAGGPGNVGPNESTLSGQDSGGAVFLLDGGVWKLAGINFGVDGAFSTTGGNDPGFNAALFDAGGFFVGGPGQYQFIPDLAANIPSSSYATRISVNLDFINAIVPAAVPAPGGVVLMASGFVSVLGAWAIRRRRDRGPGGCGNPPVIVPEGR